MLYIPFGEPEEAITIERGHVLLRVNPKTNELVGLDIIGIGKHLGFIK